MSFEVFMQVWCLQKSKLWWKQRKTGEKSQNRAIRTIGNCWEHFNHLLKFISCILYLVSKLGNSGVQRFKRYMNQSWNKEVMAVWRQPHQAVRKFRSCEMSCEMKSTCEISQGVCSFKTTSKHTCATSQVETPSSQLRTTLRSHLQAANQVAKSKFKLAKWIIQCVNHLTKSTCVNSDICNRLG